MSTQSPYEQIRFINDVIKDRSAKNEKTFFSVKLERMGVVTPLVNKEDGNVFYETIIQYLTRYDLSALIIELYHGKSHNVREPFQIIKIAIKRSQDLTLGNTEKNGVEFVESETLINPEKHFFTMAEKERANIMLEFRIKQLEWENEILKKKNKKKKQYIQELEDERDKIERNKKHSLANVTLGNITSNALETFAKSDFGIGILKNVFGAKQEVLNGLLGLDENTNTEETKEETKSTASIITETKKDLSDTDKVRLQVIKHINDFMLNADDAVLRLYYELITLIGKDVNLLQSIYMQLKGVKKNTDQKHTVTMSGEDKTEGTKTNGNGIDDS
jgi:cell division protein FtsB